MSLHFFYLFFSCFYYTFCQATSTLSILVLLLLFLLLSFTLLHSTLLGNYCISNSCSFSSTTSYFFLLAPHTVVRRTANEVKMNSSNRWSVLYSSPLFLFCFCSALLLFSIPAEGAALHGLLEREKWEEWVSGGCCYRSASAMGSGRLRCTCRTARATNNANCMSE